MDTVRRNLLHEGWEEIGPGLETANADDGGDKSADGGPHQHMWVANVLQAQLFDVLSD